jgi:transcriptional regulator with GAF, ATPase, and Fis domain
MTSEFDQVLASAVLEMAREPSVPATIERLTGLIVEAIDTCDAAAVAVFEGGTPTTLVASDEAIRDVLQTYARFGTTPGKTAYGDHDAVYSPDLSRDARWPDYSTGLTQTLGIHTVYALPLRLDNKPVAVLVLYAKAVNAFDHEAMETAQVLAVHATAAVTGAVELAHLHAALDSRTVIGQATGMVMERFGLDASSAFGVLRRLSQEQNIKLRDIADQVVETGRLG